MGNIKYKKIILKNGLSVVNISGLSTDAVTIGAYIRAGCRFDPPNRHGLSHFAEHMVFNGTPSFPTPQKVAVEIEKYGGWHRAFTWIEHQEHTVHLPSLQFEEGLKLLMESIFSPLINPLEIEKEKGIIKEEILTNKADPSKAVWDYAWFPLFFYGTGLARPYAGTLDDIQKITKKDVQSFISSYFIPERTVLFIAGDLDMDSVKRSVEKNISSLPTINFQQEITTEKIVIRGKKNYLLYPDNSYYQTSLIMGIKTIPISSPLKYVFDLLQTMLVGYSGTNLIQALRDKGGLIYGWNSLHENLTDTGFLAINLSTAHENVSKVISIVNNEFKRLAQGKFNKEEIELAKNYRTGNLLANMETGLNYIEWYGLQELLNQEGVLSLEEAIDAYRKINTKDIAQVAKDFLVEDNTFVGVVGPNNKH